jgi:beta-xylosidase
MIPDKQLMMVNLDPTVFIDDKGRCHIFWGNSKCYYAKLKANMIELDGPIETIQLPGFTEGAHIHKRNGWYYLSYGFEFPEKVAYAMSQSINGPWEFKGILNDIAYNCQTNRPAILTSKENHIFITMVHSGMAAIIEDPFV